MLIEQVLTAQPLLFSKAQERHTYHILSVNNLLRPVNFRISSGCPFLSTNAAVNDTALGQWILVPHGPKIPVTGARWLEWMPSKWGYYCLPRGEGTMLSTPQKRGIFVIHQPHLSCFRVAQWKPCLLQEMCIWVLKKWDREKQKDCVHEHAWERSWGTDNLYISLAHMVTVNVLPAETQSEMLFPNK